MQILCMALIESVFRVEPPVAIPLLYAPSDCVRWRVDEFFRQLRIESGRVVAVSDKYPDQAQALSRRERANGYTPAHLGIRPISNRRNHLAVRESIGPAVIRAAKGVGELLPALR